jgi:hypothetical protein
MRLVIAIASTVLFAGLSGSSQPDYTGRWNLTGTGAHADRVYWLEVTGSGGQLTGMFLYRTGSPVPLETVAIDNGQLVFQMRGGRGGPAPRHQLTREGDRVTGVISDRGTDVAVVGVRPHVWPAANASAAHAYGAAVALFDGTSIDAFTLQHQGRPSGWSIEDGALANTPRANNLVSKARFQDFRLQAEYKLEPGSNSGLYLRGRYELQVLDDHGKPPEKTGHLAIYGWTPPLVNASRPAGEWQSADIVLVANRVTATLNGQKVHDNAAIQAITGGALDADEASPGPILIQGDHNRVWYRRIVVTPIVN